MKVDKIYSKKIDIEVQPIYNPETSRKSLWAVVVSNEEGNRYQHNHLFLTEKEAEDFTKKILALDDLSLKDWDPTTPIYGSPAYWESPYSD